MSEFNKILKNSKIYNKEKEKITKFKDLMDRGLTI